MRTLLVFSCVVLCATASVIPKLGVREDGETTSDESKETTADIVTKHGYPVEEHKVQTSDGYILTMYRIPYGLKCGPGQSKAPVLVMHGLFCSSTDWVITGPEKGLAFLLADRCYDVWMGNNRGNHLSREHVSIPVEDSKFWKFSWHEMGQYDTPAMIDFVLHKTGKEQLFYAGHSQGTTQFWIFNSLYPEYDQKVKAMFAMAPIAFMGHSSSMALQVIAEFQAVLNWISQFIGMDEFAPTDGFISQIGQAACQESHPDLEAMCSNILFLGCGFDSEQMNMTAFPHIMAHVPAGAATHQLLHYAQGLNTGKFRQFDHGTVKNIIIYGQANPPKYDLTQNTIPVHLMYSGNDWLANVKDVALLVESMSNIVEEYYVPFEKFNHLDYMWAIDADVLLYNPMIDRMDSLL